MSRLFVSATRQHDGKTTACLGLRTIFRKLKKKVHFIKPVGQRFIEQDGHRIDEDAVLFQKLFDNELSLPTMSPVAVPRGFTEHYIFNRDKNSIYEQIDLAMAEVEKGIDITVIEGTGHAGVGSVFDASNADVAKHLDAKVIIVSQGGIGRCIDEIAINRALYQLAGVPVVGVIINKVLIEKYDKIDRAVRQGLKNQGLECLGVVPYLPELTYPTVRHLQDGLGLTVLAGEGYLGNVISSTIVAAMEPQNTLQFVRDGTLVITPGDRVDNILVSIATHLVSQEGTAAGVSGILLTGGFIPHFTIMNLLKQSHVPVLSTSEDTFSVSRNVQKYVAKIGVNDTTKIKTACELMAKHIDSDRLMELLDE